MAKSKRRKGEHCRRDRRGDGEKSKRAEKEEKQITSKQTIERLKFKHEKDGMEWNNTNKNKLHRRRRNTITHNYTTYISDLNNFFALFRKFCPI